MNEDLIENIEKDTDDVTQDNPLISSALNFDFPMDTPIDDEDEKKKSIIDAKLVPSPYTERQYLRYGKKHDLSFVSIAGASNYLNSRGFCNNNLTQARMRANEAEFYKSNIVRDNSNAHYCDFCGKELGVEYDILFDGRERCNECSRTVVKTLDDLHEIFIETQRNMEVMFSINFFASIDVRFADTKQIYRFFKTTFVPTPAMDPRILGFATHKNDMHSIWIENQTPYVSTVSTIAHELTHIWQYLNWDESHIRKTYYRILKRKYPKYKPREIMYEGMAKWTEIQYLFFINEHQRAMNEIECSLRRDDEYGIGFALYYKEYGLYKGTFPKGPTPFIDKQFPLKDVLNS